MPDTGATAGSRGRALVVEDERGIRETIAELLADEGFECREAANGRDALIILERWRPDVIILDLMMPVMDGWAFRAEQQRHPQLRHIPVVVTSAVRALDRQEVLGTVRFLPKPYDLVDILSAVQEAVQEQRNPEAAHGAGPP